MIEGNRNSSKKNLVYLVHQKSIMDWSGIETGPQRYKLDDKPPEP